MRDPTPSNKSCTISVTPPAGIPPGSGLHGGGSIRV